MHQEASSHSKWKLLPSSTTTTMGQALDLSRSLDISAFAILRKSECTNETDGNDNYVEQGR